jgi:hypothetical protein
MPSVASYQQEQKPQASKKQYANKDNPVMEDGDRYTGLFKKFSKPYQKEDIYHPGALVWKIGLFFEFSEGPYAGQEYKEFMKLSSFDGKSSKNGKQYAASGFFMRAQSLTGCKNSEECDRLDLEAIFNVPCILSFAKNKHGDVRLSSVKRIPQANREPVIPSQTPVAASGSPQTDEYPEFDQEDPQPLPEAPTVKECLAAFFATGRTKNEFGAFFAANGFGAWNRPNAEKVEASPEQRFRLLDCINRLGNLPGEDVNEMVPF